ncbi:MAG TPA: hypothetical protein VF475_14490 [Sphingobium sp.]
MTMLRSIEKFLTETGMAPTRFGREAVRDPRIVLDMRRGREPSERMCRRLRHYIAHQRDVHLAKTYLGERA